MPCRLVPPQRGPLLADPLDKVRALQHTLYRTAKADPGRRFHALWDKVYAQRRPVAWRGSRCAQCALRPLGRVPLAEVEEYVVIRLLEELAHVEGKALPAASHAWTRIALVIAKRHKRSRAYGWSVLAYQSPDHLGLISLSGIVVAPRPFKDWREKPNAGGERRR